MTRQEEKQQLRAIVWRLEAALTPEYREKSSRAIIRRLLSMPEYQEAQTVFCFAGTDHEIDTRPILADVLSSGKTLCVPLCTAPGVMELRQITDLRQLSPRHFWNSGTACRCAGPFGGCHRLRCAALRYLQSSGTSAGTWRRIL